MKYIDISSSLFRLVKKHQTRKSTIRVYDSIETGEILIVLRLGKNGLVLAAISETREEYDKDICSLLKLIKNQKYVRKWIRNELSIPPLVFES